MNQPTTAAKSETMHAIPTGVLRSRDLVAMGMSRLRIKRLTDCGALLHLGRGLYSLPEQLITQDHDLAQVCARVPQGVICLTSALQFHQLTTVSPWRIHLMLPRGARPPRIEHPPIALVYASESTYREGIEEHPIEGVTCKVTSVAKTVVDCFKYRGRVGLDVALAALKQALDEQRATRADIRHFAKVCRVENVMRPYVEALSV